MDLLDMASKKERRLSLGKLFFGELGDFRTFR